MHTLHQQSKMQLNSNDGTQKELANRLSNLDGADMWEMDKQMYLF